MAGKCQVCERPAFNAWADYCEVHDPGDQTDKDDDERS